MHRIGLCEMDEFTDWPLVWGRWMETSKRGSRIAYAVYLSHISGQRPLHEFLALAQALSVVHRDPITKVYAGVCSVALHWHPLHRAHERNRRSGNASRRVVGERTACEAVCYPLHVLTNSTACGRGSREVVGEAVASGAPLMLCFLLKVQV